MTLDDLWEGFCTPPDEARPRAWWHWMDGNVDPAGIRLDLEWLHRTGVRGVQMFDGGMGTPQVVPERVRHGSAEWQDAVRLAAGLAEQLGLEFAVATSAGWSAAGAPWVEPADAMKKLVWSETVLEGGRAVEQQLVPLPDVAGPYQDCPRWGADARAHRFARDWVAVAVPDDDVPIRLVPSSVTASAAVQDWTPLVDGSFASSVSLPRDPDGRSSAWIEQVFDATRHRRGRHCGVSPDREASEPRLRRARARGQRRWRRLPRRRRSRAARRTGTGAVPVRTVAFAPVTARRFRLGLTGDSAEAALPRLAAGVRVPPILRRVSDSLVSEFAFFAGGRVHHAELKAGFAVGSRTTSPRPRTRVATSAIDPAQVIDVTAHVDEHGGLRWTAPAGAWRVLRFGPSLTGQTNGPAPAEATGLEVDKLDGATVRHYLDTYLALFDAVAPRCTACSATASSPDRRTGPTGSVEDSPSCGGYDPHAVAAGARRLPRGRRLPRPTGSCSTTGARSPTWSPPSTTAPSRRGARTGSHLLRGSPRGPPPPARR